MAAAGRNRAASHLAAVIPVLLAAEQPFGHKNRDSYRVATGLLSETGALFTRSDRAEDFHTHLAALRAAHRPKRALREELDDANLL